MYAQKHLILEYQKSFMKKQISMSMCQKELCQKTARLQDLL
jgi:hypothetical protein